jgi:hypothetical protein
MTSGISLRFEKKLSNESKSLISKGIKKQLFEEILEISFARFVQN